MKIILILIAIVSLNTSIQAKEINKEDVSLYFEDPVYQDLWFGIYDKDNIRYAWFNINEYKEGNFWIHEQEYESKYLDSVQDGETLVEGEIYIFMEVKEYFDFNYPHLLKKIESKTIFNNDEEIYLATIDNGIAKLKLNNNGKLSEFEFPNVEISLIDILKMELLFHKYDDWELGEKIDYKSFDRTSFEISNEQDILVNIFDKFYSGVKIPIYEFKTVTSDTRSEFRTFFSHKSKVPVEFLNDYDRTVLESESEAKKISFGGVSNADEIVKTDISLENNLNIKRLVLEIDGEYSDGFYIGDRQNLYEKNGIKYLELDYSLNQDPLVLDDIIQKNLKATASYPSNDRYFIDLAKGIIGDVENKWDQVSLLLHYVDDFIEDDYEANSYSIYDILEKRKGDCTEHALFFNTLARAAGIPTREVTGIINYQNNEFASHAWNEVVIDGYWYPVDPTWNYIVPPLTHIKFAQLENVPATYNFIVSEIEYFE